MSTQASFLTIKQAAARIGVHESTVRRYADRGLIGARRLPSGVRRLSRTDVEALATTNVGHQSGVDREPLSAPGTMLDDLTEAPVWGSDDELEEFLELTYAERDRDR